MEKIFNILKPTIESFFIILLIYIFNIQWNKNIYGNTFYEAYWDKYYEAILFIITFICILIYRTFLSIKYENIVWNDPQNNLKKRINKWKNISARNLQVLVVILLILMPLF